MENGFVSNMPKKESPDFNKNIDHSPCPATSVQQLPSPAANAATHHGTTIRSVASIEPAIKWSVSLPTCPNMSQLPPARGANSALAMLWLA